jgi:hypothetical protein
MEIIIQKFKHNLILATSLLVVSGLCATNAFASSLKPDKTAPVSSLAKLDQILTKSIEQKSLPGNLMPSLAQLSSNYEVEGVSHLDHTCDPHLTNSEALNPIPCWYGSMTAKRTVVIFGDSFVGNWRPALSIAGGKLDFRVAEFSFPGCDTTFISPSSTGPGFGQNEVNACTSFHKNLSRSVNRVDPFAVIAANEQLSWGTTGNAAFITNLDKAFDEMSTATNKPIRILIGTGPHLLKAAPSCLASHPHNINLCNFANGRKSAFSAALSRDDASVTGVKVRLIPTYRWICLHRVYPAVIRNIDVYADSDHLTIAVSKFLSVLLEEALAPLLNVGSR